VGGANLQILHYFGHGFLEEEKSKLHSFTVICAKSDDVSIYDITTIACATSDDISIYDVTIIYYETILKGNLW
jgi:hypothetical protein